MIPSVPETTSVAFPIGHGARERSGAKAVSEQQEVQDRKTSLRVSSPSEDRTDASDPLKAGEPFTKADVEAAVSRLQEALDQVDPRVQLSVEEDLNRVVVKVVERESGELIRQFPPEEVLNVQRFYQEEYGFLVKEEA